MTERQKKRCIGRKIASGNVGLKNYVGLTRTSPFPSRKRLAIKKKIIF